jgi:hypothetical protein
MDCAPCCLHRLVVGALETLTREVLDSVNCLRARPAEVGEVALPLLLGQSLSCLWPPQQQQQLWAREYWILNRSVASPQMDQVVVLDSFGCSGDRPILLIL